MTSVDDMTPEQREKLIADLERLHEEGEQLLARIEEANRLAVQNGSRRWLLFAGICVYAFVVSRAVAFPWWIVCIVAAIWLIGLPLRRHVSEYRRWKREHACESAA